MEPPILTNDLLSLSLVSPVAKHGRVAASHKLTLENSEWGLSRHCLAPAWCIEKKQQDFRHIILLYKKSEYKGAGTSEASGQTEETEKLCVNDILDIRKCSKADQIMGANKYSC